MQNHAGGIKMRCYVCHGVDTYEDRMTRFCACDAPEPFIVENVPAKVCCQCGEKTYSAGTNTELERVSNGYAKPTSRRFIQVFDLDDLDNMEGSRGSVYNSFLHTSVEPAAFIKEPSQKWGIVAERATLMAVIEGYLADNPYRRDLGPVESRSYVCPASGRIGRDWIAGTSTLPKHDYSRRV
jgi:YgiT-type zinc finger domain-containing protein